MRCYEEFYVGKIPADVPLQRAVVLKWFYLRSRRNTFVGGKCALPSALLVIIEWSGLPQIASENRADGFQICGWFSEKTKPTRHSLLLLISFKHRNKNLRCFCSS